MVDEVTKIAVIPSRSVDNDATILFPTGDGDRDNAWLTVDVGYRRPQYSINIVDVGDGIVVKLYFSGYEDVGEPNVCTLGDSDKPRPDQFWEAQ